MKSLPSIICLLGALVYNGLCVQVQYNGDQVLQIVPQTAKHAAYMQEMTDTWLLDLWKPNSPEAIHAGSQVHVRIPSSDVKQIQDKLLQYNMPYTVLINDVQHLIDKNTVYKENTKAVSLENYVYTVYHPMNEIYDWMDAIKQKHSDLVTKLYLGSTYERRSIYYFKIGWPSDKKKKIMFIDCGFHAREWVSVAFCQWFVNEVVSTHKTNTLLNNVLKEVDFYVVPVFNIDGYIYTWTTERLWRKNRAPFNNGTCYGVDLNRNFDVQWCTIGASRNCSSNTFCGPSAASEPETKALSGLIELLRPEILFYLTIHSYGKMILLPYGYTTNLSKDHDLMMSVANRANAKMKEKHNNEYAVGPSAEVIRMRLKYRWREFRWSECQCWNPDTCQNPGPLHPDCRNPEKYFDSGSSGDWATDIGIKFSYTFELRDNGTYGFQLPPDQIQPTCEETTTAIMSFVEYVHENYLESRAMAITSAWLSVPFSLVVCVCYAILH